MKLTASVTCCAVWLVSRLQISSVRAFSLCSVGKNARFSGISSMSMKAGDNTDGKYSIGLALAGGGTRASSTCVGFLRGFQQMQVTKKDGSTCSAMDLIKYNSGISGGSVPTIQYSFAQVPTEELLETNRTVNPEAITLDMLDHLPSTSMGSPLTKNPLRLPQLERIPFILSKLTKIHSYWSGIVNRNFCRPLGIPSNKLFAADEDDVTSILKDNPDLKREDFLVPRSDTKAIPMLLYTLKGQQADFGKFMEEAGATISEAWDEYMAEEISYNFARKKTQEQASLTDYLLEARENHDGRLPVPFTVTPSAVQTKYEGTMKIGSDMVAFPLEDVKPYTWGTRSRFSVETALAMSTNFLGLDEGLAGDLLTNVRKIDGTVKAFTDGGLSDLTGLLPLVQRGVQKCVCIYNFNKNPPYATFDTKYSDMYNAAPSTSLNDPNFEDDFKTWLKFMSPMITCYFGYFGPTRVDCTVLNHVFQDTSLGRLKELMLKYNSLYKAGEPLVATLRGLETVKNPFWGIEAGNKIDLTFVYLNMPKKFSSNVPLEVAPPPEGMEKINENGQFTNEEMSKIPELPWDPPAEGLMYSKEQVNMISYLGSWIVNHSWEPLEGHDGKIKFNGFKEIFNPELVAEL